MNFKIVYYLLSVWFGLILIFLYNIIKIDGKEIRI